jgi:hypothetical protein
MSPLFGYLTLGEAVFGAGLLAFAPYRRQFIATLRSNMAALMAITGANELINIGDEAWRALCAPACAVLLIVTSR